MRRLKHERTLIIITGSPGVGKSYWAQRISDGIVGLVVLSYDEIKEKNFDLYGFDNADEKDALNRRSLDEFYGGIEQYMAEGAPLLIEYPFYNRHRLTILDLIERYKYNAITLYLYGDLRIIYERGVMRDERQGRHMGHLLNQYHKGQMPAADTSAHPIKLTFEEFEAMCSAKNYDVSIGQTVRIDVTDISDSQSIERAALDAIIAKS